MKKETISEEKKREYAVMGQIQQILQNNPQGAPEEIGALLDREMGRQIMDIRTERGFDGLMVAIMSVLTGRDA